MSLSSRRAGGNWTHPAWQPLCVSSDGSKICHRHMLNPDIRTLAASPGPPVGLLAAFPLID